MKELLRVQLLYNDAQLFMPATLWHWQPTVYIWTEVNFYCICPLPLLLFVSPTNASCLSSELAAHWWFHSSAASATAFRLS